MIIGMSKEQPKINEEIFVYLIFEMYTLWRMDPDKEKGPQEKCIFVFSFPARLDVARSLGSKLDVFSVID